MRRLESLLERAREQLLAQSDWDIGLSEAVSVLVEGGVVGQTHADAASKALADVIGLTAWRRRVEVLAEVTEALDQAESGLSGIDEQTLAEQVGGIRQDAEHLTPACDDMPQSEAAGLMRLVEAFPGRLLEQILQTETAMAA